MTKTKKDFFKKLKNVMTMGSRETDEAETDEVDDDIFDDNSQEEIVEEEDGQLAIDMFQTPEEIVIKTMVAGVKPEDLDISITRDMVTIRGRRSESYETADKDFFHRELYWGTFSRTIVLPAEVEIEEAEAKEQHGLLTLTLPKIDKNRQSKLKVKSS
jgi:HSP20 family protein